ncbi:MAG: hypothetical protein GXO78_11935 [Calditrichaeota bacterium]|nr:hypothetical protein [Calditrichota bacterium]
MKRIVEKKHRLDPENYVGIKAVAYTKCLKHQYPLFTNNDIFKQFERFLLKSLNKYSCEAFIYLFMPDHVHFLLIGKTEKSNSLKSMYYFSQISGYWLYLNKPRVSWQKDFYDHVLRKDEDIKKHMRYILENPVRKNLVQDWRKYPYKGSTLYNLEDFSL